MKRFVSTILSIIIMASAFTTFQTIGASSIGSEISETGNAQNGSCGENLSWTLDTSTGEFILSGTGKMPNYSTSSKAPWYSYRYSVKTVKISDGITSIGDNAFYFCSKITDVTIPETVKTIGKWAFAYCDALRDFKFSNSLTAISDYAFYGCNELKSLTIPDSVEAIGYCAFYSCSNLGSVTIGKGVTRISDTAFYSCERLANIDVEFGNTSYSSQNGVLYNQGKTQLIQYPAGRDKGAYEIPETVRTISPTAFYDCQKLIYISVERNNKHFCAIDGVLFNINKTELIQYPVGNITKSYCVPNGVLSINAGAFEKCAHITDVTLPDSLTTIGSAAFSLCTELKNIKLPLKVTAIENYAFYSCSSLETVNIPDGVEKISSIAFSDCTSLKSLVIYDGVKTIANSAFSGCNVLSDIYYTGDKYDWDKINIEVNNEPVTKATVHFNFEKETTAPTTNPPFESTEPSETLTTEPLTTEPVSQSTEPVEFTTEPETTEPVDETTDNSEISKTTITLKNKSVKIYIKGKFQISCNVENPKGKTSFKSSNTKIAKINSKGIVTGLKAGKVTITVTNNGVSKKVKLTVKKPFLNKKVLKLKVKKSFTLKITGKIGKTKFTSSNKRIATVNSKGKIVARKKGKCTITVKTNGIRLKCKVTVK